MSKILAIRGDKERGNEVIALLEMLGGKNHVYNGTDEYHIYFIDNEGMISTLLYNDCCHTHLTYQTFTLDEFHKKYPYKVGDKVVYEDDNDIVVISEIMWDDTVGDIFYNVKRIDEDDCFLCPPELLKPYKETNMNKKLAIKGHSTRGKEVIELLEMLGGKNDERYIGTSKDEYYFLDNRCIRSYYWWDGIKFTLEEFLEKYPFKIGDKVTLDNKLCTITWMCWECNNIYYYVQGIDVMFQRKVEVNQLKPYKETNMNENKFPSFEPMFKMNDELEYKIPDGYEITEVSKDTVFIKPIKPQYPKTYKECCDVLLIPPYYNLRYHTYEHCYNEYATSNTLLSLEDKLNTLGKLIICRDAYWKIAGEEMGLGKPWEPDWTNEEQKKYCIYYGDGNIQKGTWSIHGSILAFPTEEIRDAFYENFKHLIEQCKKLL